MNSNENIFLEENDEFKVEYEIINAEHSEDEEIKKYVQDKIQNIDSAIDINNSKLQEYNKQLKKFTNQADALDYTVAISSGILAGVIDSFFVGNFSLGEGKAWSNHKVNDFVMKIAKNKGYSKNRLKGAIDFLEDKFKIPSDNIWSGKNL